MYIWQCAFFYFFFVIIPIGVFLQLLGDLRNGLKEIGNQPVVSNLEDGRLGVLIDGNDRLGILHTSQVLDGSRDTDGDIASRRKQMVVN